MTDNAGEPRVTTEPNGWETTRAIEALDRGMRDGMAQINVRLDRLVTTAAFQAEQRRVDDRIAGLAERIAGEKADRVKADEEEKRERESGDSKQQTQLDKFGSNLKWIYATIVAPLIAAVLAWALSRGGVR